MRLGSRVRVEEFHHRRFPLGRPNGDYAGEAAVLPRPDPDSRRQALRRYAQGSEVRGLLRRVHEPARLVASRCQIVQREQTPLGKYPADRSPDGVIRVEIPVHPLPADPVEPLANARSDMAKPGRPREEFRFGPSFGRDPFVGGAGPFAILPAHEESAQHGDGSEEFSIRLPVSERAEPRPAIPRDLAETLRRGRRGIGRSSLFALFHRVGPESRPLDSAARLPSACM